MARAPTRGSHTHRRELDCEVRVKKGHWNHILASVLSIPNFAESVLQTVANFGIGTLGCRTAFPSTGRRPMASTDRKTFVLVHGAWHGGWCWNAVAGRLRERGHTVHTPTQTGLGERAHLLSKSITLDTFIDDIANVIKCEDLDDIVLVGHSFAGSSISGVADRMPERIRRLVYLDATILENGQTPFSRLPKEVVSTRIRAAEESSGGLSVPTPPAAAFGVTDPAQAKWLQARLTPHPLSTFVSPLKLAHKVGNGLPATYIVCADPIYGPLQSSRDWLQKSGMTVREIKTGHDAMVTAPDVLTEMLIAEAA